MSKASNHIIKNASIDFQYNGKTDGMVLQQEVRDWVDVFLKQLEPALGNWNANDEIISIDELELELDLESSHWKDEAAHQLIQQLSDKLQIMKTGITTFNTYKEHTNMQNFAETFMFYLQNGYLPWNASSTSTTEWNEQLEQLFNHPDEKFIHSLKVVLAQSHNSQERYLSIIPVQLSIHIFLSNKDQTSEKRKKYVHDLNLILHLAAVHHFSELSDLVHRLFLKVITRQQIHLNVKEDALPLLEKRVIKYNELVQLIKNQTFQTEMIKEVQTEIINREKPLAQKKTNKTIQVNPFEQKEIRELEKSEATYHEKDIIYISNAGLVLIAAFIPSYFEKIGLTNDNKISDHSKAVCMLNYLSSGSVNLEEFELVLPKILCGLSPQEPISTKSFHISNAIKKETENMLGSVIEYWNILQSTSINGLRESFLRREGKLNFNGNEWKLTVEQKPYDLLLDHLPWNFSMIQLPWMNHLLKTQWNY